MSKNKELASDEQMDEFAEIEGFNRNSRPKGIYFQIVDGSLARRSDTYVEGWEETTITNKSEGTEKTVWIERYDNLVGRIVHVEKRKQEKGGRKWVTWTLCIYAAGRKAYIRLNGKDMILKRFIKCSPNLDFNRPLLIAAWTSKRENPEGKQAFRIAQGEGGDPEQWPNIKEYWQRPKDERGMPLPNKPAKAPDGSVLPMPKHDEDEDEWDFKEQEKFLSKYFWDNIAPKINGVGESLGLTFKGGSDDEQAATPEFSGPAKKELPTVTEIPDSPQATSVKDTMTDEQNRRLKALCKALGKNTEKVAQKYYDISFHELSIEGAQYLIYKLAKLLKKKDEPAYDKYVEQFKAKAKQSKAPVVDDDDDDDDDEDDDGNGSFNFGENKKKTTSKKRPVDDDDDDDEDEEDDEDDD
jgi:hypothetical protein